MKIDYLGHSGFFAETDRVLLLFDYYVGDLSFIRERPADKPLFVFVSHVHADHYNPKIFSIKDTRPDTKYILSFDIQGNPSVPKNCDVQYMEADQTYTVEGLGTVETLLSTDEGVAYLVRTEKEILFHAGDLHWWDWPGEDPEWLAEQETVFCREIGKLADVNIDVAFAVLDDRLEENYARGLEYFLSVCHPRYVLPMHFWKDRNIIENFRTLPCMQETDTILLDTVRENHWEL